jgi:hypothetical protein
MIENKINLDMVCKHCGFHAVVLMIEALSAHPKNALYCSGSKNHKHEFISYTKPSSSQTISDEVKK